METKWIYNTPHPLTNFETQKYYQNEPIFNGVFSRDNLLKIKDGEFIINLDESFDIGTQWVALYVQITMSFISILLVWNIFQKKLKCLLTIKTLNLTFLEYKHTIQ